MTNSNLFSSFGILLLLMFLYSCSVEYNPNELNDANPDANEKSYHDVDRRLWKYFQKFEEEAESRNLFYNLNSLGITGTIANIPESGVAGTCQYGQHIHHVTIDKEYWDNASSTLLEMVVFHELGHCVLNKGHVEDSNEDGICLSIMNSGLADCYVAYNNSNREYYLDELFGKSI